MSTFISHGRHHPLPLTTISSLFALDFMERDVAGHVDPSFGAMHLVFSLLPVTLL
jgi:hypothetical protein